MDDYEDSEMEEEEEDMEEDIQLEMDDTTSSPSVQKDDGIDPTNLATLVRLKANQRQDYLRGSISGTVQATDRLMKELRDIYKSDSFKAGEMLQASPVLLSGWCLIMRLEAIFQLS